MRQQLLAHELEKARAHDCDRGALTPQFGPTVKDVWQRLLRRQDRFVPVDSAIFLDPEITSQHCMERYGDVLDTSAATTR